MNFDLQGQAGSELRYETIGTMPNRTLVVQWTGYRAFNATGDLFDFQIKLYETTNRVEVQYGSFLKNATGRTAQVGLRGNSNADFNNRTTTSNWAATLAGGANNATCTLSSAVMPPSGRSFMWAPPSPIDMSIVAYVSPVSSSCFTNNETVTVTIRNLGTLTIDFSVDNTTITSSVTGPNPQTFTPVVLTSGTLAPNATLNVTLATGYNMELPGTYAFTATITVAGDGNTSNDMLGHTLIGQNPTVNAGANATICDGDNTQLNAIGTASGVSTTPLVLTNSTPFPIPDNNPTGIQSPITSSSTANANQVISVTINNLVHTWVSDLDITLIAPNGSMIDLSSDNGGAGDNYINTVFSTTGPSITTGVAPFTGTFQPEQPFSSLTGSANGTWNLWVVDDLGGDVGTLNQWSITLPAPNTITSYAWSPSAGLSATNIANPVASPTVTTVYTVVVTDANGCTAWDTVRVTVNPSPVVALGNDVIQCGGSVTLDAGNIGDTYLWSDNSTTQTINVTTSGTYSVVVTNSFGCTGTDAIDVVINTLPTVALGNDTTQCGGSIMLDAGNPGSSYMWSDNSTAQQLNATTTGMYYVTVTDVNGCSGSDTINVTILAAPSVSLGNDITQCGGTVMLDAGNPGDTYMWSNNATTQQITVSASGTYSVLVTNQNGCTATDTITITINPIPTAIAGEDTSICIGNSITLIAQSGFSAYLWEFNQLSSNTQFITVAPNVTTSYVLTVTNGFGCTDSDTVIVTVDPLPVASFTTTPVNGFTYSFTNTSIGSQPMTVTWNFGDGSPLSNANNPTHTYTANGNYTVVLTIQTPCGISQAIQQVTVTGVGMDEVKNIGYISTYPNPTNGQFTIEIKNSELDELKIEVCDMQGRVVMSSIENITSGYYNKQFDISANANGIYFIKLVSDNAIKVEKLVLQK